ncbi:hypothetical protein E2C01_025630 [Portunus trituberculatus]|uniref:Uncharacterized protein n=1 Tax=Portunus trituberculatus TaxID=210409 RepID=A0A5B7EDF2_PORTR|nr:hypothetical protein [Portunus trituberculatus]
MEGLPSVRGVFLCGGRLRPVFPRKCQEELARMSQRSLVRCMRWVSLVLYCLEVDEVLSGVNLLHESSQRKPKKNTLRRALSLLGLGGRDVCASSRVAGMHEP